MASTTSKKVILESPADWKLWLIPIQHIAQSHDVWDYVDPSKSTDEIRTLRKSTILTASQVKPQAESIMDLDDHQVKRFELLMSVYKEEAREYERKQKAISQINTEVITTVAPQYLYKVQSKLTPYKKLKALKQEVAPTQILTKLEATALVYRTLKSVNSKDITTWLYT